MIWWLWAAFWAGFCTANLMTGAGRFGIQLTGLLVSVGYLAAVGLRDHGVE